MIQQFKSTSIGNGVENLSTNSDKEPVQEILSVHETAKKLNIIPESDESLLQRSSIVRVKMKMRTLFLGEETKKKMKSIMMLIMKTRVIMKIYQNGN